MTDILENPTPPVRIDVDRHNERIFVRVNGELVATRDEKTGSIVWYDLGGRLTEVDKAIIRREVWAKMPWKPPAPVVAHNRAQRRKLRHFKKKAVAPLPSNDPPKGCT